VLTRPRIIIVAGLAFALVAGYFVAGHLFYKFPIGLDASAFLAGDAIHGAIRSFAPDTHGSIVGVVWLVVSLLAIATVTFFAVRTSQRAQARATDVSRRHFLGAWVASLAALVAGAAAATARAIYGLGYGGRGWMGINESIQAPVVRTHPEWMEAWKGAHVKGYRRLGRTGWRVSDIVLGTGQISGENGSKIAQLALERGVNYFDTSPDYSGAGSENAMGRALQTVPRDQVFVATKFCTPMGHLPPGTPVAKYKTEVEASLGRLGTDYVDLCHIHSCDEVERLLDPNVHEAFAQLKQEGKVRFIGFSTHTPNLVEVANAAIADGRFDVMMLAYHYGQWAPLGDIIARGRREHDMGVVAMKTLKGAKHHGLAGFREQADAYSQAALRWALSNPDVSCAVISFFAPPRGRLFRRGTWRSSGSTTARFEAATASRTVGSASTRAPRTSRFPMSSGTACTSRTTAGRRSQCSCTRTWKSRPRSAFPAARHAPVPARWVSRSGSARSAPTSC
jgi:aryl-alcohol dehydrogenase-like predicted oxidoreductase